jgi:hypothetical protein
MSQEIINVTYINSLDQPVLVKFTEQGLSGYSGISGHSGISGFSGESISGLSGYSGAFAGSGTSGYLPKFTGINSLTNSPLFSTDGTNTSSSGYITAKNIISDNVSTYNVGLGIDILSFNSYGDFNVGMGAFSLAFGYSGGNGIGIGSTSLAGGLGSYNIGLGYGAGQNIKGNGYNNCIGFATLSFGSGTYNNALGYYALLGSSGSYNIGIGWNAIYQNKGDENIGIGANVLQINTGSYNTAVGGHGLYGASGTNNTAMGHKAGYYTPTGYNRPNKDNLYLGASGRALNSGGSNEIIIGAHTIGYGSNTATLGNTNITDTILRGTVHMPMVEITTGAVSGYVLMSDATGSGWWVDPSTVPGTSGYSGFSGVSGYSGESGWSGVSGFSGIAVSTTGTSGYLAKFISSTEITNGPVYIDGNNRVGIGTTTPENYVDVYKPGVSTIRAKSTDVTSSSYGGVRFEADSAGAGLYTHSSGRTALTRYGIASLASWTEIAQVTGNGLILSTYTNNKPIVLGTNNLERMRILGSGEVGIGTTAPTGKLHTVESTYAASTLFERNGQTTDSSKSVVRVKATKTTNMADGFGSNIIFCIQDNAGVENGIAEFGAVRSGADDTGDFIMTTYLSGTSYERMRILGANGYVGIGTTAPDKKLEINSATGDCLRLTYNDSDGNATYYSDFAVSSEGALTVTPITTVTLQHGQIRKITTVDDTYTILATDYTVVCNKATDFTVTLPTATVGQVFNIKNINTGVVTVSLAGDTIDGEASQTIDQWECLVVQCSAANTWIIL